MKLAGGMDGSMLALTAVHRSTARLLGERTVVVEISGTSPPADVYPLPDPNPSLTLNPNRHLTLTTLTLMLNVIPHRARIANHNTNSVLNNPTLYNPKY